MNKNLYKQYDSRWGGKPYPKGSTMSGCGCGCVACTHIIIEQEKYKNYTPEPIRKYMVSQGFAIRGQGTTWAGITKTLQHYGYKVTHIDIGDPMSKAWKELNKGNRIGVILFKGGRAPNGTVWTGGGHYVAFTDYYVKDGKHYFYTKDSGARNHDSAKYGYYTYERSMKGLVYQMWIVEKLDGKKEETTKVETTTAPAQSESKTTSTSTKLAVDGDFGVTSMKALQKKLDISGDGKITGQATSLKQYHKGLSCVSYSNNGTSLTVKALQKLLKCSSIDGQLGPNTIKKLQSYLGLSNPDGYWGPNTSKAVQKWLNGDLTPSSKPVTTGTKIKGMDISVYQGKKSVANFKKAKKAGMEFIILRLGYTGSSSKKPTLDSTFETNYKNAIAAGLPVGIYYYSLATTDAKAKEEAEFCIKHLKDKTITYPVYIDMEDPKFQSKKSKATLASVCDKFCYTISAAGYKPGVYASLSWFNNKIGTIKAPHSKWVAQYASKCSYKGTYDMWQYSSGVTVPGIANRTDVNWCYKKF